MTTPTIKLSETPSRRTVVCSLRELYDALKGIHIGNHPTAYRLLSELARPNAETPTQAKMAAHATIPTDVLVLASYCKEGLECSERRPCAACLSLSNIFRIPADTPLEYLRELGESTPAGDEFETLANTTEAP